MKIRSERPPLADALSWVAQAIPKRPAIPVLSGLRIAAGDDRMTLRAFNYDVSHTATLAVGVASPGEVVLVSGLFVRDIIAKLSGPEVELVADDGLTITAGRSTYRARSMAIEDYPALPPFPEVLGALPTADLARLISSVHHAADDTLSSVEARGMLLEAEGGTLTAAATDGFRIASAECPWSGGDFAAHLQAGALAASVKGMSGEIEVGRSGGTFGIRDAARSVTSREIDVQFVPWRRPLTMQDAHRFATVRVDAADLTAALGRAGMVAETSVRLTFDGDELVIAGSGGDHGEGEEALAIKAEGLDREVSLLFSPRYLTDALADCSGVVEITLHTPDRLRPVNIHPGDGSLRVVMPRRETP